MDFCGKFYFKSLKGFTLIEIMIAMLLLSVILSIIYVSYSMTLKNIEETESQALIYESAHIAMERIIDDLQSAYLEKTVEISDITGNVIPASGFFGEDRDFNGMDGDFLRFTSRSHLSFDGNSNFQRALITYTVEEDKEEGLAVLYRADRHEFEEIPDEEPKGIVLCDGLSSVNFIYYDINGEEFDGWDSSKDNFRDILPARVTINLEFFNKFNRESPFRFMTSLSIPLGMDEYVKKP